MSNELADLRLLAYDQLEILKLLLQVLQSTQFAGNAAHPVPAVGGGLTVTELTAALSEVLAPLVARSSVDTGALAKAISSSVSSSLRKVDTNVLAEAMAMNTNALTEALQVDTRLSVDTRGLAQDITSALKPILVAHQVEPILDPSAITEAVRITIEPLLVTLTEAMVRLDDRLTEVIIDKPTQAPQILRGNGGRVQLIDETGAELGSKIANALTTSSAVELRFDYLLIDGVTDNGTDATFIGKTTKTGALITDPTWSIQYFKYDTSARVTDIQTLTGAWSNRRTLGWT